jgi:plasmid stabilization system protein ParE
MRERSPRLARSLVERILRVVDLIQAQPEIVEIAEDLVPTGAIRHFPSPPFRVIYRVTEAEIWIARIWDTRRSPLDLQLPADLGPASRADGAISPPDGDETPS